MDWRLEDACIEVGVWQVRQSMMPNGWHALTPCQYYKVDCYCTLVHGQLPWMVRSTWQSTVQTCSLHCLQCCCGLVVHQSTWLYCNNFVDLNNNRSSSTTILSRIANLIHHIKWFLFSNNNTLFQGPWILVYFDFSLSPIPSAHPPY